MIEQIVQHQLITVANREGTTDIRIFFIEVSWSTNSEIKLASHLPTRVMERNVAMH